MVLDRQRNLVVEAFLPFILVVVSVFLLVFLSAQLLLITKLRGLDAIDYIYFVLSAIQLNLGVSTVIRRSIYWRRFPFFYSSSSYQIDKGKTAVFWGVLFIVFAMIFEAIPFVR